MGDAAILEVEGKPGAATVELGYTDSPQSVPVLDEYFKAKAARIRPHIVEHEARPDISVIPTPRRIQIRELCARFGVILVFALAVAGILWLWPQH
jgi:hypothetical protein